MGVGFIDDVQFGSWNSRRGGDFKKDWIKFFEDDPQLRQLYISQGSAFHHYFKDTIKTLKQHLNQTEGMNLFHLFIIIVCFKIANTSPPTKILGSGKTII